MSELNYDYNYTRLPQTEENKVAVGIGGLSPLTTVIKSKKIVLSQESIGVEINVTEAFKRTNTIIVNGVEFRKVETDNEQRED